MSLFLTESVDKVLPANTLPNKLTEFEEFKLNININDMLLWAEKSTGKNPFNELFNHPLSVKPLDIEKDIFCFTAEEVAEYLVEGFEITANHFEILNFSIEKALDYIVSDYSFCSMLDNLSDFELDEDVWNELTDEYGYRLGEDLPPNRIINPNGKEVEIIVWLDADCIYFLGYCVLYLLMYIRHTSPAMVFYILSGYQVSDDKIKEIRLEPISTGYTNYFSTRNNKSQYIQDIDRQYLYALSDKQITYSINLI